MRDRKPNNLEDALDILDRVFSRDIRNDILELSLDDFNTKAHHSIGRWCRNEFGLWEGLESTQNDCSLRRDKSSGLVSFFNNLGITHADDMSAIILSEYYRKIKGLPSELKKDVDKYIKWWNVKKAEDALNI